MNEQTQNTQTPPPQAAQPVQAQPKSSNTALKVILGILGCCLVLVIIASVAGAIFAKTASKSITSRLSEKGIESMVENQIEKETGKKVDIDTNMDDGKFEVKGDDGSTFSIGSDSKLPADFPTDIPVYKGAKVVSSSKFNSSASSTKSYMIMLNTSDDVDTVNEYYATALVDNGWTEESNYSSSYGTTIMLKKGERTLTVLFYENKSEKNTSITLTVSEAK